MMPFQKIFLIDEFTHLILLFVPPSQTRIRIEI